MCVGSAPRETAKSVVYLKKRHNFEQNEIDTDSLSSCGILVVSHILQSVGGSLDLKLLSNIDFHLQLPTSVTVVVTISHCVIAVCLSSFIDDEVLPVNKS